MGFAVPVAREAVESLFDIIAVTVAKGGSVQITNFGSVERVDRKGRPARNPHTGEAINVAPRKAIKWTVAPRLKEFANSADPEMCTIRKSAKAPTVK